MSDILNFDVISVVDNTIKIDNTTNEGLYLMFSGAKVRLNSIDELTKIVKTINNKLNTETPEIVRKWVNIISKTHPLLDKNISDLTFFKNFPQDLGSTYMLHTTDTQTLPLEEWSSKKPKPIRDILKYKINDDTYNYIKDSYDKLNNAMVNNISTEYFDERKNVDNNYLNKNIYSNDYHIAGDYTFKINHIDLLTSYIMNEIISFVGSAKSLINWLTPINNYEKIDNSYISVEIEGNKLTVDLKGNKKGVIANIINNSVISSD